MHSSQSHEKADLGSLIKKYISLKNNIQKITCSICSKNFLSKSALKAHTQFIHQDNHILNCPYKNCKKLFNNRYRLDIHIMTHKGIKPFKCSLCGKAFSEQGTLNSHSATHSSNKPFQCEHCSYKCKTNPQLKNHYRKEHNQFDYYKCSECNLKFNKKSDLKHHLKEHEFDNLNKILNNTQSFININNINNNFINLYNHSDPLKLEHVIFNKKEWKQKLKVIKEISFGFFALDDLN